ncbi:hypothetical protein [Ferruginibacter sp.]|uniref:hypothetical protein n=1 Tax=Ferruginibacter sp. TaxID=1940288 RepID=UPI002657EAE4|nr:hypothetical protein [Ferruginibacter sp.]
MKNVICLAFIAALFSGCGTAAHIEKSWHSPEVTVDMQKLNKVLVVAILKNETNRHATEDQLVTMLKGKGVASYNYLTKEVLEEKEGEIKKRLSNEGFDGVIIMRLADVEKDVKYIPGNYSSFPGYYNRFWPYYWNIRNSFYQPGYYETTKKYTVETNVYSLLRDKLIWSGITSSSDPKNVEKLMHSVAKEVYKKMKKEGFVVNE